MGTRYTSDSAISFVIEGPRQVPSFLGNTVTYQSEVEVQGLVPHQGESDTAGGGIFGRRSTHKSLP